MKRLKKIKAHCPDRDEERYADRVKAKARWSQHHRELLYKHIVDVGENHTALGKLVGKSTNLVRSTRFD